MCVCVSILFTRVRKICNVYSSVSEFLNCRCVVEAGYPYNVLSPDEPTNNTLIDMFVKMKKCSPIVHADKVKAPTLVCIGTKDLRVPSSQGTMWYQRLKINNVKTK